LFLGGYFSPACYFSVLVSASCLSPGASTFPDRLLFLLWLPDPRHRLLSGVTRAVRRYRLAARLGFASGQTIAACVNLKRQRGGAAREMI